MFNWLKNLFNKKQECVVGTLIYEVELHLVEKKPKRKYVKVVNTLESLKVKRKTRKVKNNDISKERL